MRDLYDTAIAVIAIGTGVALFLVLACLFDTALAAELGDLVTSWLP